MLQMRDQVDHQIWWQLKRGNTHFWYDNWSGLGALYRASGPYHWCDESIVHVDEVVENGEWNDVLLMELLLGEIADHVLESIAPPSCDYLNDRPWWKLKTKGQFIVKSAWQYTRRRRQESKLYKFIWVKGLPFNVSLFMWRSWKAKLPLDGFFLRLGYFRTSKRWCCRFPKEETLPHVFFKSPVARFLWKYISSPQNTIHKEQKAQDPDMKWGSPSQLRRGCTAITDRCRLLWNHMHPLKMQRPSRMKLFWLK